VGGGSGEDKMRFESVKVNSYRLIVGIGSKSSPTKKTRSVEMAAPSQEMKQ